ncbi:uncharacterized protein MYCGRDRAFT_97964 [Zymoseptoria tritici IPO323]|uniref:Uncharacterized protein n=1 Tax=Zymoseptoria tritici (strain CBS 115943 / IPO323) TaxID=336722 RepID=F9XRX0_ZYMTI|nr:uncharacterized protein MYCGRDRAFT_97964 [Zymoseptoria tritici IPO323]EGP81993.1 hypothetical protein MYCGRDRAFT_97964 [Zymoseptoria tritici IPO323]
MSGLLHTVGRTVEDSATYKTTETWLAVCNVVSVELGSRGFERVVASQPRRVPTNFCHHARRRRSTPSSATNMGWDGKVAYHVASGAYVDHGSHSSSSTRRALDNPELECVEISD